MLSPMRNFDNYEDMARQDLRLLINFGNEIMLDLDSRILGFTMFFSLCKQKIDGYRAQKLYLQR